MSIPSAAHDLDKGSGLRCHLCEICDRVHVARRARFGGWDFELRAAHSARVVNKNLPVAKAHLLMTLTNHTIQGVTWGAVIEENGIRVFAFPITERVGLENSPHFRRRAHHDSNGLSGVLNETRLKLGGRLRRKGLARRAT